MVIELPWVHRGGEAGHRDRAPVAVAAHAPRVDGRSGPRHRRGGRGRHPRRHPGGGGLGVGGDARRVVRQGGAPPSRGARARRARRERRAEHDDNDEHEEGYGDHEEYEGNEAPVEVTPETVVEMLGAPVHPDGEVAGRTGRPGVACRPAVGGGDVVFVEATRMPGSGALPLTGPWERSCRSPREPRCRGCGPTPDDTASTRPSIGTPTCICTCSRARGRPRGSRPGSLWRPALASTFTGRPVRSDLAMTGEITLFGQMLPVGGIKEKVLAAHRCGLAPVVLPHQNKKQVDEVLGDDLRHAVEVHYVTRVDDLLELALRPAPAYAAPVIARSPSAVRAVLLTELISHLRGPFRRLRGHGGGGRGRTSAASHLTRHVGRTRRGWAGNSGTTIPERGFRLWIHSISRRWLPSTL